jgi:DNA polymerase-1
VSDNIPGVPGIGSKTAADLLGQFGSIDVLYKSLPEVRSERLRARLQTEEETVRRNQQLIRLGDVMRCDMPAEEWSAPESDAQELRRLYSGWGFKNLLAELEETAPAETESLFDARAHAG